MKNQSIIKKIACVFHNLNATETSRVHGYEKYSKQM